MKDYRWLAAVVGVVVMVMLAPVLLEARELEPKPWKFTGPNAGDMKKAVDDDLGTWWQSDGPQVTGMAVTVDLGKSADVYEVFLSPGGELSKYPRSLNVYVGDSADTLKLVAQERGLPRDDKAGAGWDTLAIRDYTCLRFAPAKGRFMKLEIGPNGAGLPWAVAEMDVHAATQDVEPARRMAVVVDGRFIRSTDGKPVPASTMKLAANDLQHYLMEILDVPVDIVTPDEAAAFKGLRFCLVTPPEEKVPSPEPDPKNLEDVSVVRAGDEIRISGPTQRAVLFGVYEFLDRQGVRWLYPEPHGEVVPPRKELDLSMLPISYRPPFSTRGLIWPGVEGVSAEQFNLFQVRNCFNMSMGMGNGIPLGTVPRMNCGFGWAHTMGGIFSGKDGKSVEEAHPTWWPGPYRKGWSKIPCTSNPEVLEFILQKMEDTIKERVDQKLPPLQGFSVHPNDSPCFCECPDCEKRFGKPARVDPDGAEESNGTWNYSDRHFYLINALAERLKKSHPDLFLKTLAYSNHELAPKMFEKLPDNVLIDICPWWNPLPVSAPQNVAIRDNIKAWGSRCKSIGIWSYVLIYSDTTFGYPAGEKNLVIPNVRGIVSQNQFYKEVGIRQASTQLYGPQKHWPWGLYAFARTTWRPDEKAETILQDFFRGYYGEAGEPMLKWYEMLERIAIEKNIDTSAPDPRLIGADTIEPLRALLAKADKKAQRWYEKKRVALARYDTEWTFARGQWKTKADRTYPCYRLKEPPAIDGKLDDAAWKAAPELAGFRIAATRIDDQRPGRFAFQNPTRFRMGWDDKFLYLGMVCQEPDIEKTKATDAKDTKFEYRNLVEIFFAPEAPPYYRQTLVSSAGYVWGPLKIRQVNSHLEMKHPDFACKTAYNADGWTLEARFPMEMVVSAAPKEGDCWPANFVRVAAQGAAMGEHFSTWSDMPRYHFHQYNLGTWSLLKFRDAVLGEREAGDMGKELNTAFATGSKARAAELQRLAAFDEKVKGGENLAAKEKDATVMGVEGNTAQRRHFEVTWAKEPPTFDAVRIVWSGRQMYRRWYSLEYWDGERYRLIEDRRNNDTEVSIHEFDPVKASRLRMTVWADLEGWRQMGMVKAIEVYKREPKGDVK